MLLMRIIQNNVYKVLLGAIFTIILPDFLYANVSKILLDCTVYIDL